MNTSLHSVLSDAKSHGMHAFADSTLAHDTTSLTRRIGRKRAVRTVGTSAAAMGAVGAVATSVWLFQSRATGLDPAVSPSPSASPTPIVDVAQVQVSLRAELTYAQISQRVVESTDLTFEAWDAAVVRALPPQADGNPEGWLAPGTYTASDADDLARQMVATTLTHLSDAGVEPQDYQAMLTIASLIAVEAELDDYRPTVSRVIHNRLDADIPLELDSTVRYVTTTSGGAPETDGIFTSAEDRAVDSPYNTYIYLGLPPSPIATPHWVDIDAAANPADGTWLYFVVVNLDTHETVFSTTFDEHLAAVERLRQWVLENRDDVTMP